MDHHHSKAPHVQRLMRGHHSMGGKAYAEGGDIGRPGMAVGGGLPSVQFGKGGRACHRDMGGSTDVTMKGNKPLAAGLKRGGRARHRHHHWAGGAELPSPSRGYLLGKGGRCGKRMAMGGVGKLRKGMM